jgi:hypothetical protein
MPASKKALRRVSKSAVPAAMRTPKIDLYLRKINQEKIRYTGSAVGCDYYASWTKSCCILDFKKLRPGELVSRPLDGLLLRSEPGGGMLWNPRSGAVYRLNEAAYHAVLDVEHGLSELEVARRNSLTPKATGSLFRKLRQIA